MAHRFHIFILLVALSLFARAESSPPIHITDSVTCGPDSADVEHYLRKDFAQAALTVTGLNLSVWAYDRYVQNADFAHISWESIKENLSHGFVWDNDRMSTNMFLHPYHGNLYYNSARANGFNFWQSGLFAIGGSAMWELFLEQEYPSTNDIIATPIGGMALGEVAFRTSDLVLDDRTTGFNRFAREAAAFLIAPTRGLTRIIDGDAWRHRSSSGRLCGSPSLQIDVSAGARWLRIQNKHADNSFGFSGIFDLEYGDRYELRSTKPYDFFTLHINLAVQRSQPVISQLNIMGRLISREIVDTHSHDLSIGLYQHFDYYDSDTISHKDNKVPYKLGIPASLGPGILYRGINIGDWSIDAHAYVNAVLLGGILTDHYNLDDRNYNLASGFSVKSGVNAFCRQKVAISADYDYFRMFTWGYPRQTVLSKANPRTLNAQGDESVAYFGITEVRVDWCIYPQLYITGSFAHYMRSTRYRDFPNVKSSSFCTSLMFTYKF